MKKLKFNMHRVSARKDLLHFVEENFSSGIYKSIGKKPKQWIEELNIIQNMLNGIELCAGIDINLPPRDDPEFKKLGNNVFLYRGDKQNLRGLWLSKEMEIYNNELKKVQHMQWTHYGLGSSATLSINSEFEDIPHETFLPENFEKISTIVKEDKRPILRFNVSRKNGEIMVYAKGYFINPSHFYELPSYRLTNLAQIIKTTSKKEMEITLELANCGVKCPEVLGYYEAPIEEFLFLKNVDGKKPSEFLNTHRREIIEQDAQILASLCLNGYRKMYFADFDDKIFNGKDLYLIDVDEINNLYGFGKFDFRKILVNPSNTKALDEFREAQRSIFRGCVKDAIFEYQDSLTPRLEDKILYITKFYEKIGDNALSKSEIKEIITFPKDYLTFDRYMSMMSEE